MCAQTCEWVKSPGDSCRSQHGGQYGAFIKSLKSRHLVFSHESLKNRAFIVGSRVFGNFYLSLGSHWGCGREFLVEIRLLISRSTGLVTCSLAECGDHLFVERTEISVFCSCRSAVCVAVRLLGYITLRRLVGALVHCCVDRIIALSSLYCCR